MFLFGVEGTLDANGPNIDPDSELDPISKSRLTIRRDFYIYYDCYFCWTTGGLSSTLVCSLRSSTVLGLMNNKIHVGIVKPSQPSPLSFPFPRSHEILYTLKSQLLPNSAAQSPETPPIVLHLDEIRDKLEITEVLDSVDPGSCKMCHEFPTLVS